jgi:hypothetical protein
MTKSYEQGLETWVGMRFCVARVTSVKEPHHPQSAEINAQAQACPGFQPRLGLRLFSLTFLVVYLPFRGNTGVRPQMHSKPIAAYHSPFVAVGGAVTRALILQQIWVSVAPMRASCGANWRWSCTRWKTHAWHHTFVLLRHCVTLIGCLVDPFMYDRVGWELWLVRHTKQSARSPCFAYNCNTKLNVTRQICGVVHALF